MSDFKFDDNPFGDPDLNINPFEDPSIRQATASTTHTQNSGIPTQDPTAFTGVKTSGGIPYQNEQPAVMQPTQEVAPPTYTRSAQQIQPQLGAQPIIQGAPQQPPSGRIGDSGLYPRDDDETAQGQHNVRRNNWPPLPDKCCFQPCFYHDINVEIKPEFQKVVHQLYKLWVFHGCVLLFNAIGGIFLLFTEDISTFILSIFFAGLFIPSAFVCWYRPAYKAFRDDSSFNFSLFFFVFLFQSIASVIQTFGIHGYGTCGLFQAIAQFGIGGARTVLGVFFLLITAGFACCAAADILMMTKIHRIYRSSGASLAKAREEFTSNIAKNDTVRNFAADTAAAAVRNQFNRY